MIPVFPFTAALITIAATAGKSSPILNIGELRSIPKSSTPAFPRHCGIQNSHDNIKLMMKNVISCPFVVFSDFIITPEFLNL